jgi:translation initiation factor 2B subunit (eIF-2B alpha/beta/delta family)
LPDKDLKSIIDDRTSGAAEIEDKIYIYLMGALRIYGDLSDKRIRKAITQIKKRFFSMANILNLLDRLEKSYGEKGLENARENLAYYKKAIENNRLLTIATAAKKIIKYDSVFTLSNSSIVYKAIFNAKEGGWKGKVNIAESRPLNEGAILASDLARKAIPVTLGVDANIPDMIKNSNAVFLGADAVTQTYFVNKIGSVIALEFGSKYRKPIFVLADRGKFISNKIYRFVPDNNPPNEIMSRKMRNIEILNNYFEKIAPCGNFRYICGDEIIIPADVKNLLKRRS